MSSPRVSLACVLAVVFAACSGDAPTASTTHVGPAVSFAIVDGDNQQATVGTALANPLSVRVTDANGNPVANQVVNFVVTVGGGQVFVAAANTTTDGLAVDRWTLGTAAGAQALEVRAADATGQPKTWATIHATALAGAATAITKTAGDAQVGPATVALATPLTVSLADQYGNPVPNVAVTWAVALGAGSLTRTSSTTDATGQTTTSLTLGPTAGAMNSVTATAGALTATFTAAARSATTLVVLSGNNQTGTVGSALASPIMVQARDGAGNPVPGATVTWAAANGSGSIAPATTTTDVSGNAHAAWTLGSIGANSATATSSGATAATFSATGTVTGATLTIVSGNNQSSQVNVPGGAMVVQLLDGASQPIVGATISWSITSSPGGGSVGAQLPSPATSMTDASGHATMSLLNVGQVAGTITIAAATAGVTPATFTLTVTPGPLYLIVPQSDYTGFALINSTTSFHVLLEDLYQNPIPGARITLQMEVGVWSFINPQNSCGSAQSGPADASGSALMTWTTCELPGLEAGDFRRLGGGLGGLTLVGTGPPMTLAQAAINGLPEPGWFDLWAVATKADGTPAGSDPNSGLGGLPVTFAVTSGNGSLVSGGGIGSAFTTTTNLFGQATVRLEKADSSPVTVTVSAAGYASITIIQ